MDIDNSIKDPHRKEGKKDDLFAAMTYDRIFEMEYFSQVMQETMRICPVVSTSSIFKMKRDCSIGDIQVKTGDDVCPNIWELHHNVEQW